MGRVSENTKPLEIKNITLTFGLLYKSKSPGFNIHQSFVQVFKVPRTFNQSAKTTTDESFKDVATSFATRFFSLR